MRMIVTAYSIMMSSRCTLKTIIAHLNQCTSRTRRNHQRTQAIVQVALDGEQQLSSYVNIWLGDIIINEMEPEQIYGM